MTKRTRRPLGLIDIVIGCLLLAGFGVLCYPFASDAYVSYQNQQVIDRYRQQEARKNQMVLRREYNDYQQKNKQLAASQQVPGVASFNHAVNDQGTAKTEAKRNQQILTRQTVAQLTIPKIGLSLPVFNHTSDWLLQFGACLLDGTSYPTGGKNTHAVISAHRGVPNAELFTRVPALKKGDKFFISIGNHKLAYQVFKRQVIEPSDTRQLRIVPGQDLVTLMTCTPYMINSHRLLITGRRIPYVKADDEASSWAVWWNKLKLIVALLGAVIILGVIGFVMRSLMLGRKHYLLEVPAEATQAMVKRGRHIHSFKSDQTGVTDISLPGNHYRVVIVTPLGQTKYKAYVKKVRDKSFQLKEDH